MEHLENILDSFKDRRLLVVGDIILDRFIWGRVKKISPEAPVPVVEVERITDHLGGAANVAVNLANLGAKVSLLGVVGLDRAGQDVIEKLDKIGIERSGVVTDENRPTTLKSRVVARQQQVCRTDREISRPVCGDVFSELLDTFSNLVSNSEGVILSDYAKGVVSFELSQKVIEISIKSRKFLAVDPKSTDFSKYHGATVITPNQAEFELAARNVLQATPSSSQLAARSLLDITDSQALLVTRGGLGMLLYQREKSDSIQASAREVFDVTGAGDTVISVFSLGVLSGASFYDAAVLSNFAAGIVVAKLGTASVGRIEIIQAISNATR